MQESVKIYFKNGNFALIDKEDYELVSKFTWRECKRINNSYAITTKVINKKETTISLHRLIMNVTQTNIHIDHINHIGLDCRKINLRIATVSQNAQNKRKTKFTSSKYKGAAYSNYHKKWLSSIKINGKSKHLGFYDNEIEAALHYDKAAKEHFKEFAKLNFA